jgi:hypothetical protein
MEVGVSQTELMTIRDVVLGHRTQINVFVGVSYIRNTTRDRDSWWVCAAFRDVNALPPPPNAPDTYPPCIILETPQVNGRYPLVEDPIQNSIWMIPTWVLYWPEPVPALLPSSPPPGGISIRYRGYSPDNPRTAGAVITPLAGFCCISG